MLLYSKKEGRESYFQKLDLRLSYHKTITYLYPRECVCGGGGDKVVEKREERLTGKEGGK